MTDRIKLKPESYSDDEEDVEPLLKYSRVANDLKRVTQFDPASCLAVHEKFLALGSHKGSIHIFDHEGNEVTQKKFQTHEITVNQISIDDDGEYIASCSDDGKTVIHGFSSSEHEQIVGFDRPVKAVAISPFFAKQKTKQFVTGDDKLILTEKISGILGKSIKTTVIHKGEGAIKCIKWNGNFVAWANTKGVKIYDTHAKERITSILFNFEEAAKVRPDLYKCSMCWKDTTTLLIGWGNEVKICKIKQRDTREKIRDSSLPTQYVDIVQRFIATDFFISGIAPYSNGNIVLLTCNSTNHTTQEQTVLNLRPHVRLVQPGNDSYKELSLDALAIKGFEKYRCDLYGLEWVRREDMYFIVTPDEIILAKPRTQDDHIEWLRKHKKFEEAIQVVQRSEGTIKQHTLEAIGHQYLDYLFEQKKFEEAASRCASILDKNKESWENLFFKFRDYQQTKVIAKYLPRDEPRLTPAIYELVLYEYLHFDAKIFLELITTWDQTIYDIQTIITAVLDSMKSNQQITPEEKTYLYKSLAVLYTNKHDYSEALSAYLQLKHDDVFPFIHKHNLFSAIENKIESLMDFNTEKALDLFMANIESIPPRKVVQQLEKKAEYQYQYLDRLWKRYPDECTDYHTKMVYLYAEFAKDKLLPFLKRADGYDQNAAMKFCEQRELMREKIYLLGKMGNHNKALKLIINQLQDVKYAIEFCKEHNYEALWDELIKYSLDKPNFIKGLLDNIGSHVDPLRLIKHITEGMEIPGLRDSLVKILQDYNLQMSLREDCQKILMTDIHNLIEQHKRVSRRGITVDDSTKCGSCREFILHRDKMLTQDIVLFYCSHGFHRGCLPNTNLDQCGICSAQKLWPGGVQT